MEVPLHTLIKLTPKAYTTKQESFPAHIEAVSTWRGKGMSHKKGSISNASEMPRFSIGGPALATTVEDTEPTA